MIYLIKEYNTKIAKAYFFALLLAGCSADQAPDWPSADGNYIRFSSTENGSRLEAAQVAAGVTTTESGRIEFDAVPDRFAIAVEIENCGRITFATDHAGKIRAIGSYPRSACAIKRWDLGVWERVE